jgi:glycerol dehydrogenase
MTTPSPYSPHAIFSGDPDSGQEPPRVVISPHRYIQGKDVIDHLGRYLSTIASRRPAVLMTEGGRQRFGDRIEKSLRGKAIEPHFEIFRGECSYQEVDRLAKEIRKTGFSADSVIAVGGGKCMDAGKCVAFRLSVPVVIVPTIASTDAPCSAVSVMYTQEGVGIGPEFFPNSPALVVVDTGIIAQSPIRHLIAGIGDAVATCYEARTCFRNPSGRNMIGTRITISALTLAELCARTVFEDAQAAIAAVRRGDINSSLERIVEANTLLSSVGFESGGLAAAHAIAAGMTVIPFLHRDYLHGELVAIGLIAHLVLENETDEALRVARFLAGIGLPVTLEQLRLNSKRDSGILIEAMAAAVKEPFAHNEPFVVTPEKLYTAILEADRIGRNTIDGVGDGPFRILHS